VPRLAGSRVTVDVLVSAFDTRQTPEQILQQYPSLALGVRKRYYSNIRCWSGRSCVGSTVDRSPPP